MNQAFVKIENSSLDNVREEYVFTSVQKKDLVSVIADPFRPMNPEWFSKCVTSVFNELYGKSLARGVKFLFDHVDMKVQQRFFYTYAMPETLACFATSTIKVRETRPEERLTPNIGHFVIVACSADGQEHQLHFASQVSAVYYLMYLITRRQQTGSLRVIDLARNKAPFVALYHTVYDNITHSKAQLRHQQLLYRVVDGKIRAGYKTQVESDIRTQLEKAFATFGDNPIPFGMSSRHHLTVSPDNIVFEAGAKRLLYFQFD